MVRLVIEDDEGKTTVVPLIRDEVTIGRQEGNTIRLTERNVSRRHARLLRNGESASPTILVEDLESYNGVRINGDRIHGKCRVQPGDLIQIGDYALALRLDQKVESEPPQPAEFESMPTAVHQVDASLPAQEHGRMVVISSNLAGEIFHLNRRELVVGRSIENDLVVNHRSISRNHARIVYREGGFTIIDLASSNGVRVNATEFGTHSLVNGDIVELGHVKLRFVAAGDSYTFSQADIDDVLPEGPGIGRIVVGVLVLALVALAAFLIVRSSSGDKPEASNAVTSTPATPDPAEPSTVDVAALMAQGDALLTDEKWAEAAGIFERALRGDPKNPDAAAKRAQAKAEIENKQAFEQLLKDVDDQQWTDAFFKFEDFPQESVYYDRLSPQQDRIQQGFASGELERGRALIKQGELGGARKVATALGQKKFARRQARVLEREIRSAAGRTKVAEPVAIPAETSKSPAANPAPKPGKKAERFDGLMKRALELYAKRGSRADAVRLMEQASKLRPASHVPHQRLCAVYRSMGQLEKALHQCKMWLAKEPRAAFKPAARRSIEKLEGELNR